MCWSQEASKNFWIIGMISSSILLLFGNNIYKTIGLFFLIVVQMQLIEYFIWSDQECGNINNFASKMIVPELSLQPVILLFGGWMFKSTILNNKTIWNMFLFVFIYQIIINIIYFNTIKEPLCSLKLENKGIKWDIGNYDLINGSDIISLSWGIVYYSCLFGFPLLLKGKFIKYLLTFITIISYIVIRLMNKWTWSSRWCYYAVNAPIFFIFTMMLGIN